MQTGRGSYLNSPTLPQPSSHLHHSHQSASSYGSSEDSYDRLRNRSRSASGTSQTHYDEHQPSPPPRLLMDDFLNEDDEIVDDVLAPKPRQRRRISDILHNQDPGTMHLLLETALTDSEDFELLSPDELNMLKKEEQSLARRIAASKQKLFLEMRIRNTAQSLNKLDPKKQAGLSEQSLAPEEQRCNEISLEIYRLEKRLAELHNRRMKHTAGILQINHELNLQGGGGGGLRGLQLSLLEADDIMDLPVDDKAVRHKLDQLNNTVYDIVISSSAADAGHLLPPNPNDEMNDKLSYLERALQNVQAITQNQSHSSAADGMLVDLWHTLKSGEENLRQAREKVKNTPIEGVQDREIEDDEYHVIGAAESEDFSHDAFSEKVQQLCNRAQLLSEQHLDLRDRMIQEREAHAAKANDRARLMEELQDAHDKHLTSQRSLKDAQAQLMEVKTTHTQTQQELDFTKQQVLQRDASLAELQESDSAVNSKLGEVEAEFAALNARLHAAESKAAGADGLEEYKAQKAQELAQLEAEKQNYEGEVVRLQTELTVARAELDGAYGSRAERAAEVASNPEIKKEMADLNTRNAELQKELKELVAEYESMVKQSIDAEKERETLEGLVDTLREKSEALEVKINESKISHVGKADQSATGGAGGSKAAGGSGASGGTTSELTSMSVLRNEFKRMMRETRTEYFANLRSEQEERRKLESVIRSMRKEQAVTQSKAQTQSPPPSSANLTSPQAAPGKSGLSQSVTASAAVSS